MKTLHFMLSLKPERLYPGHGPMIHDGVQLLERYIEHRASREKQVEEALLRLPNPVSHSDLVLDIYPDTPRHRLWMAEENVIKVLRKLERSRSAMPFILQEDENLKPFMWPDGMAFLRNLPKGLVWLHCARADGRVAFKEFSDEVVLQSKL